MLKSSAVVFLGGFFMLPVCNDHFFCPPVCFRSVMMTFSGMGISRERARESEGKLQRLW